MKCLINFIFINCTRVREGVKLHQAYTQDPNLCVVRTLDEYISRTQGCRSGEECSQLLLSFVNPHKPVVSSTISGWLKTVLKKAGIDISTFKAHSTRSASTSKVDLSGAPIEQILKGRSKKSTWQNFYSKNIIQEGQLFQEMVNCCNALNRGLRIGIHAG